MHKRDRDRSFTNSGSYTLQIAGTHVATANTPGKLVSNSKGLRLRGQFARCKSSLESADPVLMKPPSQATQPLSQAEFGTAPIIEKSALMSCVSTLPVLLLRHSTDSSRS